MGVLSIIQLSQHKDRLAKGCFEWLLSIAYILRLPRSHRGLSLSSVMNLCLDLKDLHATTSDLLEYLSVLKGMFLLSRIPLLLTSMLYNLITFSEINYSKSQDLNPLEDFDKLLLKNGELFTQSKIHGIKFYASEFEFFKTRSSLNIPI